MDNKALYITALLSSKSGKKSLGFIPLPAALPQMGIRDRNKAVVAEFEAALDDVEKDNDVYVVIITGAGRAFIALSLIHI